MCKALSHVQSTLAAPPPQRSTPLSQQGTLVAQQSLCTTSTAPLSQHSTATTQHSTYSTLTARSMPRQKSNVQKVHLGSEGIVTIGVSYFTTDNFDVRYLTVLN